MKNCDRALVMAVSLHWGDSVYIDSCSFKRKSFMWGSGRLVNCAKSI